jgi:hypothetical protein
MGAGLPGEGVDRLRLAADLAPGPLGVPLGGSGPEGSVSAPKVRMPNQTTALFPPEWNYSVFLSLQDT